MSATTSITRLVTAVPRFAAGMLMGRDSQPAILMYHRIADEQFDPFGRAVSPENFQSQIEWLARKRTVLPLVEFTFLHRQSRLPRSALAITFDGGYACNIGIGAATLDRLGVPATIFLPVDLIQRGEEFWWDELGRIILGHDGPTLDIDDELVSIGDPDERDGIWPAGQEPETARQWAYQHIWSLLRTKHPVKVRIAMQRLRSQARTDPTARPSHLPLSIDSIRSVPSGIDFGSLTLTHPSLPSLDRLAKEREITQSIERCASLTGTRPRSFAYPYGHFNRETEQLVREAGFVSACTTQKAFVGSTSRRFALPRIKVPNSPAAQLASTLWPS